RSARPMDVSPGLRESRDPITSRSIPELLDLERLARAFGPRARLESLCDVGFEDASLPIRVLTLGSRSPDAPVLICVGGVHGLERIGAQVVLGFIETLVATSRWDRAACDMLDS